MKKGFYVILTALLVCGTSNLYGRSYLCNKELREVKDTVTHDVVHSKYHTYIIVFLCFTGVGNIF